MCVWERKRKRERECVYVCNCDCKCECVPKKVRKWDRYVDKDSERVWLCERGRISEVFAILSLSRVCVCEREREREIVKTSNDIWFQEKVKVY